MSAFKFLFSLPCAFTSLIHCVFFFFLTQNSHISKSYCGIIRTIHLYWNKDRGKAKMGIRVLTSPSFTTLSSRTFYKTQILPLFESLSLRLWTSFVVPLAFTSIHQQTFIEQINFFSSQTLLLYVFSKYYLLRVLKKYYVFLYFISRFPCNLTYFPILRR